MPDKDDWLAAEELPILSGLRFQKRRNDWRLGRWTAKQAVCGYPLITNASHASLEIRAAADGAPEVFQNNHPENVSISISHSRDRGFCAIGPGDHAIGCDIEWLEAREEALIYDYFAPEEISFCLDAMGEERILTVNRIWSAKESILKALREGLRRDTHSVIVYPDVRPIEGEWSPWTGRCLESARIFSGWWREEDGYIMTMVSDRQTSVPKRICLTE